MISQYFTVSLATTLALLACQPFAIQEIFAYSN